MNTTDTPSIYPPGVVTKATFHDGRFHATGYWGSPTLPWGNLHHYMVPEGWCETEDEARDAQESDRRHAGERGYHVVIHDTGDNTQKALISPVLTEEEQANPVNLSRSHRMAWAMAVALCRRKLTKSAASPTP